MAMELHHLDGVKSSLLNSDPNDTGGNHDSSWSSKSNWNSGNGSGGSNNRDDTFGDKGRDGNWVGRGGRGDPGGFRGRSGSDRGGFECRWRSDRGGFGGRRGSDRGEDFVVGVDLEAGDEVIGKTQEVVQMRISPTAGTRVQTIMMPRDGKVVAIKAVGTREVVTTINDQIGINQLDGINRRQTRKLMGGNQKNLTKLKDHLIHGAKL